MKQMKQKKMRSTSNVITFGTFDLFHIGHLNILNKAKKAGVVTVRPYIDNPEIGWPGPDPTLIVGVSSDKLNYDKKGKYPIVQEQHRIEIVKSLRIVNEVFLEESLEEKRQYIEMYDADILVMGDDWYGKFDEFKDICDVIYLPRTPSISTTSVIEQITHRN